MPLNPLASPSRFPRCPQCGLYFIQGAESFLAEAKAKFGWRIGHFDPRLLPEEWDAVRLNCRAQTCPRCNAYIIDAMRAHPQPYAPLVNVKAPARRGKHRGR